MNWHPPIEFVLVPSDDSMSFQVMKPGETALPLPPHPGAFGVERAHHVHEGIDLYCAEGTAVQAVEAGMIVAIIPFTGAKANSDWWHDTDAMLVEGASGVVLYGEIVPAGKQVGDTVKRGETLGYVKQVLKTDKGRPMSMLHLEFHDAGTRDAYEWTQAKGKPPSLRDPTPFFESGKAMTHDFIKAGNIILRLRDIERIDMAEIEQGRLTVFHGGGQALVAHDFDAFEILMLLHPAAMEGRRLRWAKHAWAFHNLVAHPLMQIMVWIGFKKQAIWLHDVTVPKPTGLRAVSSPENRRIFR